MVNDLFEGLTCRMCVNSNFERLEVLSHEEGTDFIVICRSCGTLFILLYERQGAY